MTRDEAINVLRTESIELVGAAPSVCRFLEALDMAVKALKDVPDKDVGKMTHADRIRAMSGEELAEFLSRITYGRETPWSELFARRLCDNCQTVHGTYESGIEDDFHECDFLDGECPHGSAIAWWLQQPAGEEDKHEDN